MIGKAAQLASVTVAFMILAFNPHLLISAGQMIQKPIKAWGDNPRGVHSPLMLDGPEFPVSKDVIDARPIGKPASKEKAVKINYGAGAVAIQRAAGL